MRFFITLLLSMILLVQVHAACPPDDEDTARVMKPLEDKIKNDICRKGIKIGGAADMKWLRTKLIPYYISKKWLGKEPPKGWEKEVDKIISKCHKDSYNYCVESDRKRARECLNSMAGSLMLKFGATAMAFCPVFDKILAEWPAKHEAEALGWITAYCKTKGRNC